MTLSGIIGADLHYEAPLLMPSIYDLKPAFQKMLRPLVSAAARVGLTPNAVTSIAIAASVAVGVIIYWSSEEQPPWVLILLPAWLFVRMALNAMDGMLARELQKSTALGAVLNEAGDIVSDLALFIPLVFIHRPALWPLIAFSLGSVLTEFCGVLGKALGAERRYDGPMGKSDRAFFVGALAVFTFFFNAILKFWGWAFAIAAALTVVTCLNRLLKALRELR